MSNPWQNLMPGGVAFTPRPDEEDDWGFGAPGDPVGEADNPTDAHPTPTVEVPAQQAVVSTDVDTSVQAPAYPDPPQAEQTYTPEVPLDVPVVEVPAAETLPVEETPGWAAWGEWDDEEEGDTPAQADPLSSLLAPGQWATHAPEPTTPATEAPAQVPAVETPPVATPVVEVPAIEVPAQHVPVEAVPVETLPVEVPVVEASTPASGHPLPQPHPSVPPLHDPALPPTPAPVPSPLPSPVPDESAHTPTAPFAATPLVEVPAVEVPVVETPAVEQAGGHTTVEGYVPEGYVVNPHTGELTALPVPSQQVPAVEVTAVEVTAVEVPVAETPAVGTPVVEESRTAPEGYWLNPFTMAIEPKPATTHQQITEQSVLETVQQDPVLTEAPVPNPAPVPTAAVAPVVAPVVEPVPVVPYEFVDDETHTPRVEHITGVLADLAGEVNQDLTANAGGEGDSSAPLLAKVTSVEELLEADEDFSDIEEAEAAAEAAAKAAKQRQSRATRPVAVTERDVAVLQFLARYRMATYPQLAAAFGISYTALRHRMPRLAREGLVVRKAIGKSTYSVWMPTDAGMKVADMDLTLPTLSWATVAHTLGLVDIGIRFEALGEVVVTEREIRAADTRDQPTDRMHQAAEMTGFTGEQARLYVVEMGDGSKQYAHIPDMVLARPPAENGGARSVAIELELNHKPSAQWRKILTAYLNAPHISQVIYFTHQSKVRSGILAAAKEVGAEHIVRVRKFEPSEDSAIPLPGK